MKKQIRTTAYIREVDLKRRYGFSVAEYDEMLAKQDGGCAICGGPPTGRGVHFHVDHNHATGAVRGLLCNNCNRAIGLARDDPSLLKRMAFYLEHS